MNLTNSFARYQNIRQQIARRLKIIYQKPLTKETLNLILSLSLSLFFILFALRPTILIIVKLWKEIEIKQEIVKKLDKKITNLNQAQISLEKAKNLTPVVNKVLPPSADFPRFERELVYLALENNLQIASINFDQFYLIGKTPETDPKKQISISFNSKLTGSFENIKNFLADLENLDRIVILEKTIINTQSEKETNLLNLVISGEISYYPPEL